MLRNVEVVPIDLKGKPGVALRDPLCYAGDMIAMPNDALAVLQFFDGKRSIEDILKEIHGRYDGEEVLKREDIETLAKSLDDHFFLVSEKFLREKRRIDQEFYRSDIRLPVHAGLSYNGDPEGLNEELGSYFSEAAPDSKEIAGAVDGLRAVIAPHISIVSGGECFAHSYSVVKASPRADLYVILGIGHAGLDNYFAGTKKDFETPLGTVKTDTGFMERLGAGFDGKNGAGLFSGEALHRTEHTIEFQAVLLKYVFGEEPFVIAPILTSFPYQLVVDDRFKDNRELIERFISALKSEIESYPGKVVIISSVDFAHVGVKYGAEKPLTTEELEDVKRRDDEMIEIICGGDAERFASQIGEDDDGRNICGFSSIYVMLRVLEGLKGRLLRYDKTVMDNQNSTVTFAGMAFTDS
jgi:AmmeMemoRadiSam system protein B